MVQSTNEFPLLTAFMDVKGNANFGERKFTRLCILATDLANVTERAINNAAIYLDHLQFRHDRGIINLEPALLAEVVELSERITDTEG